ncbi:hypothetical protein TNCV_3808031 [Trichonephila clavipes]|nr:hypothetical protein TNCV_3808031 [Trichonephila clavipes]
MDIHATRSISEGRVTSRGSERSMHCHVMMHPSERLMIRLPPRWISFPMHLNSNTSISVVRVVVEVDVHQLDFRITIHVHLTLPMHEETKWADLVSSCTYWQHLLLSNHDFLCNYRSS